LIPELRQILSALSQAINLRPANDAESINMLNHQSLGGANMRIVASVVLVSIFIFLAAPGAAYEADDAEIRGAAAAGDHTWNALNFPGFYFDADSDLGTEELAATITDGSWLSGDMPYGLVYTATAQAKRFGHSPWGAYRVIGFLGRPFFAGYVNDAEITVTTGSPLKLGEGYELRIRSVDEQGQSLHLQLAKDGQIVDARSISPFKSSATESERTYSYSTVSNGGDKVVIIAAHFKNAFSGADQGIATVSGLWQISEVLQPPATTSGMPRSSRDSTMISTKTWALKFSVQQSQKGIPSAAIRPMA
jgi:S-layer protein (TIGR01567 family)